MDGEAVGGVVGDVGDSPSSDAQEPVSEEGDGDDDGVMSMPPRRRTTAKPQPRPRHVETASPSSPPVGLDQGCRGGRSRPLLCGRCLLVVVVGSAAVAAMTTGVLVVPRRWSSGRGRDPTHDRPRPQTRQYPPRRILVVGLIADPGDLLLPTATTTKEEEGEGAGDGRRHERPFAGNGVVKGLVGLCSATRRRRISDDGEDGDGGYGVDVYVTYRHVGTGTGGDDGSVSDALRGILLDGGCRRVRLEKEEEAGGVGDVVDEGEDVSRYQRLARLRSRQRAEILSENRGYDAVVNVDLDVLSLPPVPVMLDAVENAVRLSSSSSDSTGDDGDEGNGGPGSGAVVCANGYETWPLVRRMRLYYDTLASVDAKGEWYYRSYSLDPLQVVTFGQARLYRRIRAFGVGAVTEAVADAADVADAGDGTQHRQRVPRLWRMRTCFGGMAVYDFATWSAGRCDYDRDRITLPMDDDEEYSKAKGDAVASDSKGEGSRGEIAYWSPSGRYTLDGKSDGDACEHVVFQMCLAGMYRTEGVGGGKNGGTLIVGIQPDLVVGREANFSISFSEDWARVSEGAVVVVVPILVVLSVVTRGIRRRRLLRPDTEAAVPPTKDVLPLLQTSGKDKEG